MSDLSSQAGAGAASYRRSGCTAAHVRVAVGPTPATPLPAAIVCVAPRPSSNPTSPLRCRLHSMWALTSADNDPIPCLLYFEALARPFTAAGASAAFNHDGARCCSCRACLLLSRTAARESHPKPLAGLQPGRPHAVMFLQVPSLQTVPDFPIPHNCPGCNRAPCSLLLSRSGRFGGKKWSTIAEPTQQQLDDARESADDMSVTPARHRRFEAYRMLQSLRVRRKGPKGTRTRFFNCLELCVR